MGKKMSAIFSPDFDAYASGKLPAAQCHCVLCGNVATECCCPPFGHPAYFALIDFRHGRITADDPEFRKWFRLGGKEQ
jgi:hypothetical protein